MENVTLFIPIATAIIAALIGVLHIIMSKQKQKAKKVEKDYNVFIALGTIWLIAGLASEKSGIWPLGLIFLFGGLAGKLREKKK